RLGAEAGFDVDEAARAHPGTDVRDGVVNLPAVAAALDEHRLIQVRGPGRVDGDERHVGGVPGRPRDGEVVRRLGEDRLRERTRNTDLLAYGREVEIIDEASGGTRAMV